MKIRTLVSFQAKFPKKYKLDDDGLEVQPGKGLVDFLHNKLQGDFNVSDVEDREGWAWEFEVLFEGRKVVIHSIIALADDGPREWLVTSEVEDNYSTGIFFWKKTDSKADVFAEQFFKGLHRIITSDSRFKEIRWYFENDFDTDHGDTWSDSP